MKTISILITGKVQGVFYRASAKEAAQQLGLGGWVKNTPDGNVEIAVTGSEEDLRKFTAWCRQGPLKAKVYGVIVYEITFHPFSDFRIIR